MESNSNQKPCLLRALSLAILFTFSHWAGAADHAEAPRATSDPAADIADVYIFRGSIENRLYAIMTFAGISQPAAPLNPDGVGTYDPDVLYIFSVDTNPDQDGDNIRAEYQIFARFGVDAQGNFGIKVENLPGTSRPVVGPVETVITSPEGFRVYAGLRDDPFFFDIDGFRQTLGSFGADPNDGLGSFMFDNTRDGFGFRNISVIVIEMDERIATRGQRKIRFWGTTAREASDE